MQAKEPQTAASTDGLGSPTASRPLQALSAAAGQNVQVAIRCRPFNAREKGMAATSVVDMPDGRTVVLKDPTKEDKTYTFTFDAAYGESSSQAQFAQDLGLPIVDKALVGFNGTIFAYGQTGSGKTFTMMGNEASPGLIPILNSRLFSRLAEMSATNPAMKHLVMVSYLEVYQETLKDLLNPSDKQLVIREHPEMGVYVQDLAEIVVKSEADVVKLLDQGQKVRHVAATNMNDRSSRSHSCLIIKIEQKMVERTADKEKTTTLNARLNLVDLAGSERAGKTGATGDTLKQGAAINKSLSALGNVINALADGAKKGHIPYRDSKLTRLLQHSLGGNCMTVMVATISPADDNFEETLSTLQYANRAKNIKNEAKRNEDVNEQLIRQLREEIEGLRKMLAAAQAGASGGKGGGNGDDSESDDGDEDSLTEAQKAQMEEMIANLERAKQQTWEEKERLSALFEQERQANLANEHKIRSVMTSIKEDNLELMKRMRTLATEKAKLQKQFKKEKDAHLMSRESLAAEMARYQELFADGGEEGPHKEELADCLARIERLHLVVESEAASLKRLKEDIKTNEGKQMEERAAAAAQRVLLEEDAELRAAIQEEERKKAMKDHAVLLEQTLEAEKKKIRDAAEQERAALLARFNESGASEREHELELALVQASREKGELLIDISRLHTEHEQELARLKAEHKQSIHALKVEELRMFRELVAGFEEEKAVQEARVSALKDLLAHAVKDLEFLTAKNAELERQLFAAAAWEPPAS